MMYQSHRIDVWEQGSPNTILWTSYTEDTWLTALDEKPPEVKTSYIEVPASDGVIDLTDAVAGRPIYGKREVDFTVEYVGSDHDAALEWLQDSRATLHGKRLCVSTPDSRSFGGWFVGRLTVTQIIVRDHAKLTVHVDCSPWIYYGVEHVALAPGTVTTVDSGTEIPVAVRATYPNAMVSLIRTYDGDSASYSRAIRRVSLVQSSTDNIVDMPGQAIASHFVLAGGGNWDSDWAWSEDFQSRVANYDVTKTNATRTMFACRGASYAGDGTSLYTMFDNHRNMYIGVHVYGTVTDTDSTYGTPSIKVLHQGGRRLSTNYGNGAEMMPSLGGIANPNISSAAPRLTYTSVDISNGTFEAFVTMRADMIVYGESRSDLTAWITCGLETSWVTADVTVEFYLGYVDSQEYIVPSNIVASTSLPTGMYAGASTKRDRVDISKVSSSMLTTNYVENGTSVTALTTPATFQLSNLKPQGQPKWVWGYGDWYGYYIPATVTLASSQTATVDAGEMPTVMSITTSSPLYIVIDGTSYLVTSSGYAPFAFSGEKTITYTLYGVQNASIDYEKGII